MSAKRPSKRLLASLEGVRLATVCHHQGRTVSLAYLPREALKPLYAPGWDGTMSDAEAVEYVQRVIVELDGRPFTPVQLAADPELAAAAGLAALDHLKAWGRRAGFQWGRQLATARERARRRGTWTVWPW